MPYLTTSAHARAFDSPLARAEVFVNGSRLSNVRVNQTTERVGIEPSVCELVFPLDDYGVMRLDDRDIVEVWIARCSGITNAPKFRGYPASLGRTLADGNTVVCHDLRGRLESGTCSRNYNVKGVNDVQLESLGIRQILQDVWAQYTAHTSSDRRGLSIDLSNVPNTWAGEVIVEGQTFGEAIAQISRELLGDSYIAILDYSTAASTLRFVTVQNGRGRASVFYGIDPTQGAAAQPAGIATASVLNTTADVFARVNHLIAHGGYIITETASQLIKGWSLAIESEILSNPNKFMERGDPENENPNFDISALEVWRRFKIPCVNDFGTVRQATPYRKLVSTAHKMLDAEGNRVEPKAFLVVEYQDGTQRVYFDFSIENDVWVICREPLWLRTIEHSEGGTKEVLIRPSKVWLNWSYISNVKLTQTINERNTGDLINSKRLNNPAFLYYREVDNFILSQTTRGENSTVSKRSGSNVVRDDSVALLTWGRARLREMNQTNDYREIDLGRGDLTIKPGMRYYENLRRFDSIVLEVAHDTSGNFNTTIRVGNRA